MYTCDLADVKGFVLVCVGVWQFYDAAVGDYDHAIVLDPNNHR